MFGGRSLPLLCFLIDGLQVVLHRFACADICVFLNTFAESCSKHQAFTACFARRGALAYSRRRVEDVESSSGKHSLFLGTQSLNFTYTHTTMHSRKRTLANAHARKRALSGALS
eukprot:2423197-Pleurochrysis_carterae.AAC.3